ncbi:hypothetical protein Q8W25_06070 [Shimia thalassica]|uniref:hypothetical protein n=1 Tax=Shimia thalassica TaxID=1715693 RepID=UPI002734E7A9|nr:hypothetical protein [Shimia thalassica]MDP2493575.1 hypothetical protein [Shimia thalassica]
MAEVFELSQIEISQELLNSLSTDQRAMFAALSLAISEIETLRSGLKIGPKESLQFSKLNEAFLLRQFALMRLISFKIYEIFRTLGGVGSHNNSDDQSIRSFRKCSVKRRRKALENLQGQELVRVLRNKVGFHFDLNEFRKVSGVGGQSHELLSCIEGEFQSSPLGDIYVACMLGSKDSGFSEYRATTAKENLSELSDYIVEGDRLLNDVWADFLDQFILPHVSIEKVDCEIPSSLVASRGETPFALFVRRGEA